MSFRIAFGGIHIESTTFTSYISTAKDFVITRNKALLERYPFLTEKQYDIVVLPLVMANAIPGGVVSRTFFNNWMTEYLDRLMFNHKEEPIDGILLDLHGAMSVEGIDDAEGFVVKKIREVIGNNVVISASMDLHGNVSDDLFNECDLLTCYRTAPHIDVIETRQRAIENLLAVLKTSQNIVKTKVNVPILLPGEKTSTVVEPGKSLYQKLYNVCNQTGIIDASIWMGFPWADQRRSHSAIVIIGTDEDSVRFQIEKLSNYFWSIRNDFTFVGPVSSLNDAINESITSKEKPFFISDTGDNPGAGGAGDINIVLDKFLQTKTTKSVLIASIYDSETITNLYQYDTGNKVSVVLGSKVDKKYGTPLSVQVVIKRCFYDEIAGRCAVVSIKNIDVIVTEKRYQYGTLKAFNQAGIKTFDEYDIIVVKMGYLEPDLSKGSNGWVMALTEGAVSQNINDIKYKKLQRPLYPLDDFEFTPYIQVHTKKHQ